VTTWLHTFLTSALDTSECSASNLAYFTAKEEASGTTEKNGVWWVPQPVWKALEKKKNKSIFPRPEIES